MRRWFLLVFLSATLGCPRSDPKGDDKKDTDMPVVLPPPTKLTLPSQPVEPEGKGPDEKAKF